MEYLHSRSAWQPQALPFQALTTEYRGQSVHHTLTSWVWCDMIDLLIAQRVGDATNHEVVTPGREAVNLSPCHRTAMVPTPPDALSSGGVVFLPPSDLERCRVRSSNNVGLWLPRPPAKAARSESVRFGAAHAENALGGKSPVIWGALPSAAKAEGRDPTKAGSNNVGGLRPGKPGGHRHHGLGRNRSKTVADVPMLPAPPGRNVGPTQRAYHTFAALTTWADKEYLVVSAEENHKI